MQRFATIHQNEKCGIAMINFSEVFLLSCLQDQSTFPPIETFPRYGFCDPLNVSGTLPDWLAQTTLFTFQVHFHHCTLK